MSKAVVRFQLELSPETDAMLKKMAEIKKASKSKILRESIVFMKHLLDAKQSGKRLFLIAENQEPVEITYDR